MTTTIHTATLHIVVFHTNGHSIWLAPWLAQVLLIVLIICAICLVLFIANAFWRH
jgi:glycopeptide antibiotics resistance protein